MRDVPLPQTIGDTPLETAHPVRYSQVSVSQLMAPQDVNLMGNVFGGVVLALVDRVAYVCASRHAGRPCVTASFDSVDFRSPIRVGELVTLRASVNYVGRTSMEIGVRVEAEDLFTREIRHTNSCYVTMVALGPDGRPTPVPKLILETPDEVRRYHDAVDRRKVRLHLAEERRRRRAGR
jgi:acyl-CoA hydrolase